MADQYINPTGLQAIKEWAKSKFTNKIEKIRVNGAEKTPDTNKAVDLVVPDYNSDDGAGSKIFTAIDSMNNPNYFIIQRYSSGDVYLIWRPYTGDSIRFKLVDKDYVDENGGKIDKIKVNSVEQPITNKEVDIEMPVVMSDSNSFTIQGGKDTTDPRFQVVGDSTGLRFNEVANGAFAFDKLLPDKTYVDSTFRTEAQVQQAIDDALADVTNWDYSEPMLTLPATGEKGIIYLVAKGDVLEPPYDEWYWLIPKTGDPHFEKFGDTTIDLSTYWTMTDGKANSLVAMTVSEINAILNA